MCKVSFMSDRVGLLIAKLKVIDEDVRLLRRLNQPIQLLDYGNFIKEVNVALLDKNNNWVMSSVERVEAAGFLVAKNKWNVIILLGGMEIEVPIQEETFPLIFV